MACVSDDWRNRRHVVYRLHAHIVLTPKYAVVSAGGAPLDIVKRYIENQQSPNRKPGQLGKIRGRQRA